MIEITDVKYDPNERVEVYAKRLMELEQTEAATIKFYNLLKVMVLERYVENYACFGNGGSITYEELAELLHVDLPRVAHVGVTEYLKIKREVKGNGKKKEK